MARLFLILSVVFSFMLPQISSAQPDIVTQINSEVNHSMKAKPDNYEDIWSVGTPYGDCEDFALTKMKKLLEAGVPRDQLQLYAVTTFRGERHMVLVTNGKILDVPGFASKPYPINRSSYTNWLPADPNRVNEALTTGESR